MKNLRNRKLVVASMLGAITIALGLTPLGFIPLGIINATTMHIPVIIAGILEGPVVGMAVGLIFGLSSLFNAVTKPTPMSIVFYNPLISILPRVLIGLTSYYAYSWAKKLGFLNSKKVAFGLWGAIVLGLSYLLYKNIKTGATSLVIALNVVLIIVSLAMIYLLNRSGSNLEVTVGAFIGSMTNTILVMGGIYFLYAAEYMKILKRPIGDAGAAVLGVVVTSGIPEAIISVIIATSVVNAVRLSRRENATNN
ncbi:ECF transporter S component [Peptoniphilus catoniae]|uniref:ECF transporter S component n=1 Tax=Peptoniphilus catoniae TaxID=1660341 RepID=UPI0010FD418E|nr:ECF transporter S component [Peptoniphilus catoniae]